MELNKNSKIFLTGATGFVGGHVLKLLKDRGYTNLTCLKREKSVFPFSTDFNDNQCRWVTGDLTDLPLLEEQVAAHEVIIHMAADVTFSTKNKKKYLQNAINTSANIVNAALYTGVKKIIHISSVAAIGRKKQRENIDEHVSFSHSPYDTTYGLAKFLAEQEIWRGHAEGLEVTVLNPSMILGKGDWKKSSIQLFDKISKGLRYYPKGTTGWVSVEDVAQAVFKSLQGDFNGERFIISAENKSYHDIFDFVAQSVKASAPKNALSQFCGQIGWRIEKIRSITFGIEPLLTKETLMSTSVDSLYDNSKSVNILQIQYSDIKNTIMEAGKAFLEQKVSM